MRWRGPCAWHRHPIGELPRLPSAERRPPGPGTRSKYRFPGPPHVPGVAPRWCPFPTVKAFLLPQPVSRKSLREFISSFFPVHTLSTKPSRLSARHPSYPPPYAQPVHNLTRKPATAPAINPPSDMKPGFQCARATSNCGFMSFQRSWDARILGLVVPGWPESGFWLVVRPRSGPVMLVVRPRSGPVINAAVN